MMKIVMMKLLLLPIVFLSLLVIPTASAETPYIFVQIIPKDHNGNVLGLFQLDKVTRLNHSALDDILDFEFSLNTDSVYQLDDKKIQVIIRENTDNYTSSKLITNTSIMANTENGIEEALRFSHDGYMVSPGESVTTIWYFVRTI